MKTDGLYKSSKKRHCYHNTALRVNLSKCLYLTGIIKFVYLQFIRRECNYTEVVTTLKTESPGRQGKYWKFSVG